jgi:hypothetical protein
MFPETELKQNEDVSIPSRVTVNELIHLYDRLILKLNENAMTALPPHLLSTIVPTRGQSYIQLRLVCSLLLGVAGETKMSLEQCSVLESTARKAQLLQHVLDNDGDDSNNHLESSLLPVTITPSTDSAVSYGSSSEFEWKFVSCSDDGEEHESNPTGAISLSMSPQELLEEERMLLNMANAPIPTEMLMNELTDAVVNAETILHQRFGEEWGESVYQQKCQQLEQLRRATK